MQALRGTYIVTCDPVAQVPAARELQAVDGGLDLQVLEPGILRVTTQLAAHAFTAELARREAGMELIFCRHVQPADYLLSGEEGRLPEAGQLVETVAQLLQSFAGLLCPGVRMAVHVRRAPAVLNLANRELRDALGEALVGSMGVAYGPEAPEAIVSLFAWRDAEAWHVYVGAAPAPLHLSPWPGGRVTFRREPGMVSRAQFKLLEAARHFELDLEAGGQALDLGAAPGGWSWELGRRGWQVTAVDPAPLDPKVAGLRGVRHRRQTAEELAVAPDAYDLILCDINWDPERSARALVRLAPALRPDGRLLFMLKWMAGEPPLARMGRVFARLEEGFRLLRAKHLYYNRAEVSVLLARR